MSVFWLNAQGEIITNASGEPNLSPSCCCSTVEWPLSDDNAPNSTWGMIDSIPSGVGPTNTIHWTQFVPFGNVARWAVDDTEAYEGVKSVTVKDNGLFSLVDARLSLEYQPTITGKLDVYFKLGITVAGSGRIQIWANGGRVFDTRFGNEPSGWQLLEIPVTDVSTTHGFTIEVTVVLGGGQQVRADYYNINIDAIQFIPANPTSFPESCSICSNVNNLCDPPQEYPNSLDVSWTYINGNQWEEVEGTLTYDSDNDLYSGEITRKVYECISNVITEISSETLGPADGTWEFFYYPDGSYLSFLDTATYDYTDLGWFRPYTYDEFGFREWEFLGQNTGCFIHDYTDDDGLYPSGSLTTCNVTKHNQYLINNPQGVQGQAVASMNLNYSGNDITLNQVGTCADYRDTNDDYRLYREVVFPDSDYSHTQWILEQVKSGIKVNTSNFCFGPCDSLTADCEFEIAGVTYTVTPN